MDFLDKLLIAKKCEELDDFISDHIEGLTAFLNSDYETLLKHRFSIEDYITESSSCIGQLDCTKYYNSYFVLSFLDYFERFKLPGGYQVLYQICQQRGLSIGKRHDAAYLYLVSVNHATDHFNYLIPILTSLQAAYETEEDNELNILVSFANYLSNVISNTVDFDKRILQTVLETINQNKGAYSFLSNPSVNEILSIDIATSTITTKSLEIVVQKILKKKGDTLSTFYFNENYLIENDTDYHSEISKTACHFDGVRSISMNRYNSLTEKEKKRLADELGRGVKVIDSSDQLCAYMTLYGKKHRIKLQHAYNQCSDLTGSVNVVDWGCGQGLASMLFLQHFFNDKAIDINSVLLIEPSLYALKRAALHIEGYGVNGSKIKTINSDFDSLKASNIVAQPADINVHLFSNVLDMETFDANNIVKIIEQKFKGNNLFLCVSPYIISKRTDLLDIFMGRFNKKYPLTFKLIHKHDEWGSDPTKAIRIFGATIT